MLKNKSTLLDVTLKIKILQFYYKFVFLVNKYKTQPNKKQQKINTPKLA